MDHFHKPNELKNETATKRPGINSRRDDLSNLNIKGKKKYRPRGSRGGASKRIRKQKIAAQLEAQLTMKQNTSDSNRSYVGNNHRHYNEMQLQVLSSTKIDPRSCSVNHQSNHSSENYKSMTQLNQEHHNCCENNYLTPYNLEHRETKENKLCLNAGSQPLLGSCRTGHSGTNLIERNDKANTVDLDNTSRLDPLLERHRVAENHTKRVSHATYSYPNHTKIQLMNNMSALRPRPFQCESIKRVFKLIIVLHLLKLNIFCEIPFSL